MGPSAVVGPSTLPHWGGFGGGRRLTSCWHRRSDTSDGRPTALPSPITHDQGAYGKTAPSIPCAVGDASPNLHALSWGAAALGMHLRATTSSSKRHHRLAGRHQPMDRRGRGVYRTRRPIQRRGRGM